MISSKDRLFRIMRRANGAFSSTDNAQNPEFRRARQPKKEARPKGPGDSYALQRNIFRKRQKTMGCLAVSGGGERDFGCRSRSDRGAGEGEKPLVPFERGRKPVRLESERFAQAEVLSLCACLGAGRI